MICELCGKNVNGGFKVRIEGSMVSACESCSKLGEVVSKVIIETPKVKAKPKPALPEVTEHNFKAEVEYEVVDDFGPKIKAAREKRNLSQEDLGKMLNEPHSLIHRVELGKYEPSPDMARKFEQKLGIKLLSPHTEIEAPDAAKTSDEITLGDMIVVRKRKN
jgi:putative transcription factor